MARIFLTNFSAGVGSITTTTNYPPQLHHAGGGVPFGTGLEAYGILDVTAASEFGTTGTGNGQFMAPQHLVFDSITTQNMLVADKNNDRIQFFDINGNFQKAESTGTNSNPTGIDVHPINGKYYIGQNETLPVIRVYQASNFMQTQVFGVGVFTSIEDVKIGINTNNVYVLDNSNRIRVFTDAGIQMATFQLANSATSKGISLDFSENIYVADSVNEVIQIYTSDGGGTDPGTPFEIKGGQGIIGGKFDGLLNVHVEESQKRLITSEAGNVIRIQFFSLTGILNSGGIDIESAHIRSFNNSGGGNWTTPYGIEFFTDNRLFVSDESQDKVTIIDQSIPEQNILFDETGGGGSDETGNIEYDEN